MDYTTSKQVSKHKWEENLKKTHTHIELHPTTKKAQMFFST